MKEIAFLQLMLTKGIGDVSLKKIMLYIIEHPNNSFETIVQEPNILMNILNCNDSVCASVLDNKDNANRLWAALQAQEVDMVLETDSCYPQQLKDTLGKDAPPVLFVKGNRKLLKNIAVGFCGSRKVSAKGISITSLCAQQLSEKQITIVSGYAAGTDLAAHRAAMTNNGNTIFVLAEGILSVKIKSEIKGCITQENHLFISQFLPNSIWNAGNAMKRNSVIIGLSRAMILVESSMSGGTFAAGEETLRRAKPLFVIDFAKPDVSAEANPYFIHKGGQPIRGKQGIPHLQEVFNRVVSSLKVKEDMGILNQLQLNM